MKHKRHFQEIKDTYYKSISSHLFRFFPNLKEDEDLGPYYTIGKFHSFFVDNIDNIELFSRSIHFINESFELGKHQTEDVFVVEFFTPVYDDIMVVEKLKKELKGNALAIFVKYYSILE